MNPYEDLIHALGREMGITLNPDSHQACLIQFPEKKVSVQIDLDTNADQILIGSQLGQILPGPYRDKLFIQALRVNGMSELPRGFLAFSEKNDSLVLFQFLPLAYLTGADLHKYLQLFVEHARIWKEAVVQGEIPKMEEESSMSTDKMFGLKK